MINLRCGCQATMRSYDCEDIEIHTVPSFSNRVVPPLQSIKVSVSEPARPMANSITTFHSLRRVGPGDYRAFPFSEFRRSSHESMHKPSI